uniref:Uncharacterized protein AlNc14C28G2690 n=1 Tax=Albugo laibachii Nc14 TaxID=890382 RepID=F0W761_9STRA|nr:cleavage induced hypothetical protein [Albugo laibachii Nc14]|eukprot:CCA16960.1 cleavage induced hypothetical protein [Albugo laibachii Nc14]
MPIGIGMVLTRLADSLQGKKKLTAVPHTRAPVHAATNVSSSTTASVSRASVSSPKSAPMRQRSENATWNERNNSVLLTKTLLRHLQSVTAALYTKCNSVTLDLLDRTSLMLVQHAQTVHPFSLYTDSEEAHNSSTDSSTDNDGQDRDKNRIFRQSQPTNKGRTTSMPLEEFLGLLMVLMSQVFQFYMRSQNCLEESVGSQNETLKTDLRQQADDFVSAALGLRFSLKCSAQKIRKTFHSSESDEENDQGESYSLQCAAIRLIKVILEQFEWELLCIKVSTVNCATHGMSSANNSGASHAQNADKVNVETKNTDVNDGKTKKDTTSDTKIVSLHRSRTHRRRVSRVSISIPEPKKAADETQHTTSDAQVPSSRDGEARRSGRLYRKQSFSQPHSTRARATASPNRKRSGSTSRPSKISIVKMKKKYSKATSRFNCDLLNRFMNLHDKLLSYFGEEVMKHFFSVKLTGSKEGRLNDVKQDLFFTLLASGYLRFPWIRTEIIENLQNQFEKAERDSYVVKYRKAAMSNPSTNHSSNFLRDVYWQWPKFCAQACHNILKPNVPNSFWNQDSWLETVFGRHDFCALFGSTLLNQIMSMAHKLGTKQLQTDCIPGYTWIFELLKKSTKEIYGSLLCQLEPVISDDSDSEDLHTARYQNIINNLFTSDPSPASSSLSSSSTSIPATLFYHLFELMKLSPSTVPDILLTILSQTNYQLPYHVVLCFKFLERLQFDIPTYFSMLEPDTSKQRSGSKFGLFGYIFSCLLDSEHFEILKMTELFLLKHFSMFPTSIQDQIVKILEKQWQRLFFHWHRDVRYCFFHILLYLVYPGNRIVLSAQSDEIILGSEKASRIFDCPGLIRTDDESTKRWKRHFEGRIYQSVMYHQMLSRESRLSDPKSTRAAGSDLDISTGPTKLGRRIYDSRKSNYRSAMNALSKEASRKEAIPVKKPAKVSTMKIPDWLGRVSKVYLMRSLEEYNVIVTTYYSYATHHSIYQSLPVPEFDTKS